MPASKSASPTSFTGAQKIVAVNAWRTVAETAIIAADERLLARPQTKRWAGSCYDQL